MNSQVLPLQGIRVVDWTIWHQGPVSTAMLADMGAEVIKIEQKDVGDPARGLRRVGGLSMMVDGGRNAYFEYTNRNKKSVAVDLRKDAGKEIIYRLVEVSDVFVQNFRQGVAKELGLDYSTLREHNPRIIYASASGYGRKGAEAKEPAYDMLGLARSGMMNGFNEPGLPPMRLSGAIADQTGGIMLSYGILAALLTRERFGISQEIDVSMLGSMIALQGLNVAVACAVGQPFPRLGREAAANPLWNHYKCSDGSWICLAHLQPDRYWAPFCRAVGREDLINDPRFADTPSREKNAVAAVSALEEIFATKTAKEWTKYLKSKGDFIVCPVNSMSDVIDDPQALINDYVIEYDHPVLGKIMTTGFPVQFSKTPSSLRLPAPEFGQHTEEVLTEYAGYSWEEVEELGRQGVI